MAMLSRRIKDAGDAATAGAVCRQYAGAAALPPGPPGTAAGGFYLGWTGIEAATLEAAGLRAERRCGPATWRWLPAMADVVLVVGVEKFTDVVGTGSKLPLATTGIAITKQCRA